MSREMISAIARDFNKNMCSDREVLESCTECAGSIENSPCPLYEIATRIYKAGYRKQSEVEELEKEVERLTTIINSYALQYGTVTDKQAIINHERAEVAREFIEIINDRIDNIRARIPYGGRSQGKTLAVEKMRLLESLKVEIAKKYTEERENDKGKNTEEP